jgi:GNAT superfamily N-acetyltransferase
MLSRWRAKSEIRDGARGVDLLRGLGQRRPMALSWIVENPAYWDADKARVLGPDRDKIFPELAELKEGELVPSLWWRVEDNGAVVGYGWMDATWGDAEVLVAVAPERRGQGVGSYIMDQLESEAHGRGLNHLYNAIPIHHPAPEPLAAWLEQQSFRPSEDGKELRRVVRKEP